MQQEIRQYIFELLSAYSVFGNDVEQQYRKFTQSPQDGESFFLIEARAGEIRSEKSLSNNEPYGYTEVIILDNAYPGESRFAFELNTIEEGGKEELFFLEISSDPDEQGQYLCQTGYVQLEEEEESLADFFRISEFKELSQVLKKFEAELKG